MKSPECGGPEGDRTLDLTDANRTLSQTELRAQICAFYAEKVVKFGFLKYAIFREKTNKSDGKTGGRKSGRMCLAMDANRALIPAELRAVFCRIFLFF